MTSLDYASFYETHVRPRQRRRRVALAAAAVVVWLLPVAWVGLTALG